MAEWGSSVTSAFQTAASDSNSRVSYGPFSVSGSNSYYANQEQQAALSFSFQNNELNVKGPQIIGYVLSKIPRFPNYAE